MQTMNVCSTRGFRLVELDAAVTIIAIDIIRQRRWIVSGAVVNLGASDGQEDIEIGTRESLGVVRRRSCSVSSDSDCNGIIIVCRELSVSQLSTSAEHQPSGVVAERTSRCSIGLVMSDRKLIENSRFIDLKLILNFKFDKFY